MSAFRTGSRSPLLLDRPVQRLHRLRAQSPCIIPPSPKLHLAVLKHMHQRTHSKRVQQSELHASVERSTVGYNLTSEGLAVHGCPTRARAAIASASLAQGALALRPYMAGWHAFTPPFCQWHQTLGIMPGPIWHRAQRPCALCEPQRHGRTADLIQCTVKKEPLPHRCSLEPPCCSPPASAETASPVPQSRSCSHPQSRQRRQMPSPSCTCPGPAGP